MPNIFDKLPLIYIAHHFVDIFINQSLIYLIGLISIVVISTYIVNIANHIMGRCDSVTAYSVDAAQILQPHDLTKPLQNSCGFMDSCKR